MRSGAERQRIEDVEEPVEQDGRVCRVEHGDVVRTDWEGKKQKQAKVYHLQGPYLEADSVDCDCCHWVDILDAFGGENVF